MRLSRRAQGESRAKRSVMPTQQVLPGVVSDKTDQVGPGNDVGKPAATSAPPSRTRPPENRVIKSATDHWATTLPPPQGEVPSAARRRGSKRCRDHGSTPLPSLNEGSCIGLMLPFRRLLRSKSPRRSGFPPEGGAKRGPLRHGPTPSLLRRRAARSSWPVAQLVTQARSHVSSAVAFAPGRRPRPQFRDTPLVGCSSPIVREDGRIRNRAASGRHPATAAQSTSQTLQASAPVS